MIRMTRLTDYGIMLLTHFVRDGGQKIHSARELAVNSKVPQPTVSKIFKLLARNGLLVAHRGVKGGFTLARKPDEITVAEIVKAIEGPISFTECSAHPGKCEVERLCIVRSNWRRINDVVVDALRRITLADMARPFAFVQRHSLELQKSVSP